ncbi:MAG TPA: MBL fold metallo-hydrolase [Candidatus Limiplasma stercoravium]|nr:MBL fold metallo-hydrolase [Candidatus Limiplasma stercoravium]
MDRLIVLGTGNATVTHCYNTCFLLSTDQGPILCDAGGGNGILVQLERAGVPLCDIHHLILTHAHSDHVLGAVWILRLIATRMNQGRYEGELHIHCHPQVQRGLVAMARFTLQKKMTDHIGRRILFDDVSDGCVHTLAGREVTFFDIRSTKMLQYGFSMPLASGGRLCCLGDEPYNPDCESHVAGASWLLSEAFCLYGDRERFKPYEKHHSTVKDACELAQRLGVKHLVLWHTEDSDIARRKERYTQEGRAYYSGDLHVPNDLETIALA